MDSRTASFDRRRPHDQYTDGGIETSTSSQSTPRKRARRGRQTDGQDLRDFVPGGASFSSTDLPSRDRSESPPQQSTHGVEVGRDNALSTSTGAAPLINWNLGSKAKIRTTLGGTRPAVSMISATTSVLNNDLIDSSTNALQGTMTQSDQETMRPGTSSTTPKLASQQNEPFMPQSVEHRQTHDESSGDDRGVILNLDSDEHESGEISEGVALNSSASVNMVLGGASGDGQEEDPDPYKDEAEDDGGTDAMMNYSDSNSINDPLRNRNGSVSVLNEKRLPRTLADLSPADLQLQLQYFYTTIDPQMVNGNNLVRCLVCVKEGHTSDECKSLTCLTCHAHKDHFTQNCPTTRKCQKCRERGHDRQSCPYKLGRMSVDETECDLCQQHGHIEDDCELLWRTSGRPWESKTSRLKVHLGCYECGKSGHLGNDCPTRHPRKPMGTSSWAIWSGEVRSVTGSRSNGGITIKGRAQQPKAAQVDSSEDEQANFYRSKVPPPARMGQIRVANDSFGRYQGSSSTSINAPPRGGRYDDRRADQYRDTRDSYGHYRGDNRRRSRSPQPPAPIRMGNIKFRDGNHGGYDGNYDEDYDSYKPPLPTEPPPLTRAERRKGRRRGGAAGGEETYRPMPSAAQNAWKKHRT